MDKKAVVYMPRSSYLRMIEHIFIDPYHECGGFLIGNRVDLDGGFLFSVRNIYYEPRVGTHSSFELDIDYTSSAQEAEERWQENMRCDDYLIGTYHSHGIHDAFHSSVDDIYAKKFNLMIICSPTTQRIEVWYWSLGESRWYEGSLVVYEDGRDGRKSRSVRSEDSTLSVGTERFPMRSYCKGSSAAPKKKMLMVGCGTLGNLIAQHLCSGVPECEITLVDRDYYEPANLPRSPMIDADAVGTPKAFALAKAIASSGGIRHTVRGVVADIRMLSLDFFEQFDLIVTPLDNLECRYYLSYVASVLNKPLVNLGTSYTGINGMPTFSGDVFYKPSDARTCLDCFYPLYRSNEKHLKKRVSCGGAVADEVAPQVISSSMLVASVAFLCMRRALSGDRSSCSVGYNIGDVSSCHGFFDSAPIKAGQSCSFNSLHSSERIKTVRVCPDTRLSSLYCRIKSALGDSGEEEYDLDMMGAALTHIKYRRVNPIHSIHLDPDTPGRICQVIGEEYFPRDHVYAVDSSKGRKYIRIIIK